MVNATDAKQSPEKTNACVYCGVPEPTTVDHVPPRSFYGAHPPDNLITVPCCGVCNQAFGKDDDYVRLVFATAEGAMGNPTRDELLPKLKRFAERPESKHILRGVYQTLRTGYVPNDSGILVRRDQFEIEGQRLDRFAVRVTKALFYREKGYRLPDGCAVNAFHYRRFDELLRIAGKDADFWEFIITKLNDRPVNSWGPAFAYTWLQSPNGADSTWWMLHFYGNPLYLSSTFDVAAAVAETIDVGDVAT